MLRLRQPFCRASLKIKNVSIYGSAAGAFTLFKNPIISGGSLTYTTHPDPRSMTEYISFSGNSTSSYTITGGIPFDNGFFDNKASISNIFDTNELTSIHSFCSDIKGNLDTFVVAACSLTATLNCRVAVQWMEIT